MREVKASLRDHREIIGLVAAALAIRYLLMPFNHIWDITTFHNLFVNLATGTNPYDEFVRKTYETRASVKGWSRWYAYYAYPPGLIYLYSPLADLWAALVGHVPATKYLPVGRISYPPRGVVNPWFLVLFKTPIFLADIGIGLLLARMAGQRAMKLYLFNPLVILVSAMWMFDAIPLFFLLAGVYLVNHDHPIGAGVSIGLGTIFKFFPVFVAPAIALYYLRDRDWSFLSFGTSLLATIAIFVAPYAGDVMATLDYHGSRVGGGLTLHTFIHLYSTVTTDSVLWLQTSLSPTVGSITLIGGLAFVYVWAYNRNLTLYSTVAVTLAGFMLSTKLVNEQYGMWLVPFLILVGLEHGFSPIRRLAYKASYALPIGYAIVNVPILIFFYPLGFHLQESLSLLTRIEYPEQLRAAWLSLVAVCFVITMLGVARTFAVARPGQAGLDETDTAASPANQSNHHSNEVVSK
jgi:hypothetical protein